MNSPAYNVQQAANQTLLYDNPTDQGVVHGDAPVAPLIEAYPVVGDILDVLVLLLVAAIIFAPAIGKIIDRIRK